MPKPHPSPTKAAIYARFSSNNQRHESIDAQIRAIEEYAYRNNYDIVAKYIDEAKSATTDKRPGFLQMISDSSKGEWGTLFVHKLDRFSRDKYDSTMYKRKLKSNGVNVVSITENLSDSPEGIILESVLEGMSEFYSANLSREVQKGMKETALQCKHTGGKPPLGYDVDPETRKLVVNQDEATIVKEIFNLYNAGYGYGHIVEQLNNKGYKTKLGRRFGKNSLYEILNNEKYKGVYIFNKTSSKRWDKTRNNHSVKDDDQIIRIKGGIPAIVTEEAFDKAGKRMQANKRNSGSYTAKEYYLLSGLVYCGKCNSRMTGNRRRGGRNKSRYVTYKCNCKDRTHSCDNKEIRKEYIEAFVLHELEKAIFEESNVDNLINRIYNNSIKHKQDTSTQRQMLSLQLEKIDRSIENYVQALSECNNMKSLVNKLKELELVFISCFC